MVVEMNVSQPKKEVERMRKLACPDCKGTTFEVYLVKIENFFPEKLGKNTQLTLIIEKCRICGWESNTTNRDEAIRRASIMLRRLPIDWKGFVDVEDSECEYGK